MNRGDPMQRPPEPLDYRRPGAEGVHTAFSLSAFFVSFLVLIFIFGTLILVVPRFDTIFRDFGVKLPALTVAVLEIGRFVSRFWWVCVILIIVVAPGLGFIVGLFRTGSPKESLAAPTRRRTLRMLVFIILGLYTLFLAVALLLPMISLVQAVSQ